VTSSGDLLLTVLSGGTGTSKLLQGLLKILKPEELSVIVNTGEDVEISGLNVSPDIDTVMYALAGIVNEKTWYGIKADTFFCHEALKSLGHAELLRIGDRDRATKMYRTLMLKRGKKLSTVTKELCEKFGVRANVMPMSDDRVQTCIRTENGAMKFHDFWVARKGTDRVLGINFDGAEDAEPAPGVMEAIEISDFILIGPSNPITSIGPILAVKEIRRALSLNIRRVVVISPIVGYSPISGPAKSLMQGLGYEVSPLGVARIYRGVAGMLIMNNTDKKFGPSINEIDIKTVFMNTLMPDRESRVRLARELIAILNKLPMN
jgi:LPPG:FO 2-phospho-L-lactate transferase